MSINSFSLSAPLPALTAPVLAFALALAFTLALAGCGSSGNGTAPSASSTSSAAGPPSSAAPSSSASADIGAPPRCAARSASRIEPAAAPGASSSIEIVRAGGRLYALVADNDERALHAIDIEAMQQVGVTPLPGRPGHVLAIAGGLVAVTLRDTGRVLLLEPTDDALAKPFEERCAAAATAEPWALATAGDRLLVGSGFGAALTVFRAGDLTALREIPLPREPRAVLVTNGGATAFVSHAVGGVVSVIDLRDLAKAPEAISLLSGSRLKASGELDEKRARGATQGYALASVVGVRKDGERDALRVFAPHTSVDPGAIEGGTTGGYGGGPLVSPVAAIVSVLDPIAKRSITNDVARSATGGGQECLLPRSAVADEESLFVACLDVDAVDELDPWLGDPSVGVRRRFSLPAGPSAIELTADKKRLVVWSELDRSLSRIEREGGAVVSLPLWRRAGEARDARIERGRRLFHTSRDARIAQSRACASCHPEGRDDGLVWTSPDGARQTATLAGRLEGTAPYGWFGESPTVRDHVARTFERLGGTGFSKPAAAADFDALLAYIASLPPPPPPPPADAKSAERGKAVFGSYGCKDCHKNGDGTDGLAHNVGSGDPKERRATFDTPSLRGARSGAPYFHDGRYATLDEVLSAKDTRMFVGNLTDGDKKDLIAYLETL